MKSNRQRPRRIFCWPDRELLKFLLFLLHSSTFLPKCSTAEENLTTVLVCEGGLASLHCPPQHEIVVRLANFGRFALQPCNPTMRPDISVKCHNPHSIDVLRASCDHRQECRVMASTEVFSDQSCADADKYLEAHYACLPTEVTTTTSTTTLSTTSAAARTTIVAAGPPSAVDEEEGKNDGKHRGCPARMARNLHWPRTPLGQTVRLGCPLGSRGQADWHCSGKEDGDDGVWSPPDGPNLSRCISDWARDLREDLEEVGMGIGSMESSSGEQRRNWLEVLREGHAQVRKEELMGGDAAVLAEAIADIVAKLARRKAAEAGTGILLLGEPQSDERRARQKEALEFVQLIIDTLGHLLRANQRAAWLDLPPSQRQTLAIQLLKIMPQTLQLLLPLPNWPKAGSESLLAEPTLIAEVAQASIYEYVPFPSMSLYRQNFDTVILPKEALQLYGQDLANVLYTAWDQSLANHLLGETEATGNKMSSGISSLRGRRRRIVTKLVSISVVPLNGGGKMAAPQIRRSIGRPIQLTFQNMAYLMGDEGGGGGGGTIMEPNCVWWNWDAQKFVEEEEDGEGRCQLGAHNQTHIVCECRAMNTHFGVMADVVDTQAGQKRSGGLWGGSQVEFSSSPFSSLLSTLFLLSILTSLAGLCLCLPILILLRPAPPTKGQQIEGALFGSSGPPSVARSHIGILLIAMEAILLVHLLGPTDGMLFCQILASLRDYTILAILCWTLLDALQLCHSSRRHHFYSAGHQQKGTSHFSLLKIVGTFLFAYGFPLLILATMSFLPSKMDANRGMSSPAYYYCWSPFDGENAHHLRLLTFIGPTSFLLFAAICSLLATFWTLRSGNAKCAQKKNAGAKFFTADYHPCSTNSTTVSGNNGNASTERSIEQLERCRMTAVQLRQSLKWLCARLALLAAGIGSAICWAFGDGPFLLMALAPLVAILANSTSGLLFLAEIVTDKKTRASYQRLRRGKLENVPFLKPLDWLLFSCLSPSPTRLSKRASANYSPPATNRANGGGNNFTPNSSSSSTSSAAGRNGGAANGAMSACSELSTTADIQLSSSGGSSENYGGGGGPFSTTSHHPPPPAPLLQLYNEHKMLQSRNGGAASPHRDQRPGINGNNSYGREQQRHDGSGNAAVDSANPYDEYATIPYEELLTAYHRQQRQMYGGPSFANHGPLDCTPPYSPRHPTATPRHLAMNNYGGPGWHSPYPIRFGMVGSQQVCHQQVPAAAAHFNGLMPIHHYGAYQATEHTPPILEMGIHSAPPAFPPPPPPAPSTAESMMPMPMAVDPVHFRRSSSGSLRGGSTLVLRMDLSRQQPLISERIDSVDELLDEE